LISEQNSISYQRRSSFEIKNTSFDSSCHGALTHVFIKTIQIYLPFQFEQHKWKLRKKILFVFFILMHVRIALYRHILLMSDPSPSFLLLLFSFHSFFFFFSFSFFLRTSRLCVYILECSYYRFILSCLDLSCLVIYLFLRKRVLRFLEILKWNSITHHAFFS